MRAPESRVARRGHRLLLLLLSLGVAARVAVAAEAPPAQVAAAAASRAPAIADAIALLDLWVEEQRAYHGIPGVAIGVVHDGELVWAKGYGVADLQTGAPVTPRTTFRVGSLTKVFTATAVLQLRDAGKLDLDDPVTRHLPWFRVASPFADGRATAPITLRHLLTHTAGLPREAAFPYWTTHDFPSREQIRAALAGQRAVYPPGETYKYSNLGVALLGEVVTAVSGEPWAAYVDRHILAPLGMTSSTAAPEAAEIAGLAAAYQRRLPDGSRRPMDYYDTGGIAPAAAIVASLEDLARFAALQLSAGDDAPAGGAQILSGTTLAEMHRTEFVYPSFSGGRGLGFAVSRRDDTTFVGHGGWIGGHRGEISLVPQAGVAVVALTNGDDVSPGPFVRMAYELVGKALAAPAPAAGAEPATTPNPAWRRYLGTYSDPWSWEYEVLVLDGELVIYDHGYPPDDDPRNGVTRLTPVAGQAHTFRMPDGEPVVFEMTEDGSAVRRLRRRYEYLMPVRR